MTKENVVDKIRKLLRLARDQGATENEAAVALGMAQRLMMQHNITDVEEERFVEAIKGEWMNVSEATSWGCRLRAVLPVQLSRAHSAS